MSPTGGGLACFAAGDQCFPWSVPYFGERCKLTNPDYIPTSLTPGMQKRRYLGWIAAVKKDQSIQRSPKLRVNLAMGLH